MNDHYEPYKPSAEEPPHGPLKVPQLVASRFVAWRWRIEEVLVTGPRSAMVKLWVWTAIKAVVVLGCWVFVWDRNTEQWWPDGIAACVVGLAVGLTVFDIVRRAVAYRRGWNNGRHAMRMTMFEAMRRGMSPVEWAVAELERDGFAVTVKRDDESGDE